MTPGRVCLLAGSQAGKPPSGHGVLLTGTRLAQAVGHGGLNKGEGYSFLIGICARSAVEPLVGVVCHRRVHSGRWTAEETYRDQVEFDARMHSWLKGRAERELRLEASWSRAV